MEWYYALNGQQTGPVDETEFNRLINAGIIQSTTLVWHAGLAEWQPLAKVQPAAAADGTAFRYAGFWIRFAAKFIDGLIIGLFVVVPVVLLMNGLIQSGDKTAMLIFLVVAQPAMIIVNGAYTVFFVTKYGATPGKMACGLKIVTPDGDKIPFGRSVGRYSAEILSGMVFYVGYIIAAFDDEKRALHDHICNTRVIYK